MEISDNLVCLFTGTVEEQNGTYRSEIPQREVTHGGIDDGATYRVAIFAHPAAAAETVDRHAPSQATEEATEQATLEPPVEEGERREVEIENLGSQGDGIARVERGYVIIVPETEPGDTVTVEITTMRENVAFVTVIDREEPVP